jgi:hypothetical protein
MVSRSGTHDVLENKQHQQQTHLAPFFAAGNQA